MNKMLLLAGTAACLFAANANAVEIKPYVGAKLKYVDLSSELNDDGFPLDGGDKVAGGSIAVGLSTKLGKGNIRAELEYNGNDDAEKTSYAGIIKTKVETQSVMLNGYYDIDTKTKITPYIGAGIGYAKVKGTAYTGGIKLGSMDDDNFAWQVGFGTSYAVNEHICLDAGYRYMDYGDFSEDGTKLETYANEIYIGARYVF